MSLSMPPWAKSLIKPFNLIIFAVVLAVVVGGIWGWKVWRANQPQAVDLYVFSANEEESAGRLSVGEGMWMLVWRHSPGVGEGSVRLLGSRRGEDAARVLGDLVRGYIQLKSLVIMDSPAILPRRSLAPWLFGDETLGGFLMGQSATLYPDELTVLLWVMARQVGLGVGLVWLEPEEPTLDRWPCVALRVETGQGGLVLDPRTGELLQAGELEVYGAELLWAGLAVIDARYSLHIGDLEASMAALGRVNRLVPGLWTAHALGARVAHGGGRVEEARGYVGRLREGASTHPFALYVEALVAADKPGGQPPDLMLLAERLKEIVDANPSEARLAVELGDLQIKLRQYDSAWDAYDLALSREPGIAGAHTGLAWLYALADPARAQEHIRQELRRHAQYSPVYIAHAFLLASLGDEGAAEEVGGRGRRFAADVGEYEEGLKRALEAAKGGVLP